VNSIQLFPVPNLPLVQPGDDIAALILEKLRSIEESVQPGDILVIAQKIVSKAEGRLVKIKEIAPGEQAKQVAEIVDKDPRVIQIILDDSREIIRQRRGLFVVEQRSGWICANAGVDRSNVQPDANGDEYLALLPTDADASAERIRQQVAALSGVAPAVIISDSHGRAWRTGTVGVALGCAGMPPLWNQRGLQDLFGYELQSSEECIADELAAAASLLMGQSNEGQPVILIRGYRLPAAPAAPARSLQRPAAMDAFR
jgi:coenzyme F420-0:L-glutamate ligase/coenzyme F420-1:gamma-L-glutamate ligase